MALWDKLGQRLTDFIDDLSSTDTVRDDLQQGGAAFEDGRPVDAEESFRRVVAAQPQHGRARHLLGLSLLQQDRLAEAIACLKEAVSLRPEDFDLLVDLAEAQRLAADPGAALSTYKQALHASSDDNQLLRIFSAQGEIHLQRGLHAHAVRELRKAVALDQGEDLQLLGLLGRAQYLAGDLFLARHSLSKAAMAAPPDPQVLLLLTNLLLELGRVEEARLPAQRLLELDDGDVQALLALARCALGAGELSQAREHTLRALQRDPRRAETHALLGEVHAAAGDGGSAVSHLRTAIQLGEERDRAGLLRRVLLLEVELDPTPPEMAHNAGRLLALLENDPLGLACAGLAKLQDHPEPALELLTRALATSGAPDSLHAARLGLGLYYLQAHRPQQAATTLRAALRLERRPVCRTELGAPFEQPPVRSEEGTYRAICDRRGTPPGALRGVHGDAERRRVGALSPQSSRARSLLGRALGECAGPDFSSSDFYPFLRRIHHLLQSDPRLSSLSPEVARIQEVFDRPLLLTVMGEFNSGKSTFVNALIGEKVAPMGITPTTATINILKYGEQRGGRVVWRDDREERLAWSEVGPFLDGLSDADARRIRHVELLYPAEELLRVNVVDTPGLNSLVEEHEQTAREILGQADAVVWLFSAHQAGKQTEEEALELLRQHRVKTVGVLNKIDKLTKDELSQVLAHLHSGFEGLVETVLPVSTRQALEAMVGDQQAGLEQSRFPALRQFLEEQLFARGRLIKRQASQQRLQGILDQAIKRVEEVMAGADQGLDLLQQLQLMPAQHLNAGVIDGEQRLLRSAREEVYQQGADEVLDFVRPRTWALGQHQTSQADQDFLQDLLIQGLRQMCESSNQRIKGFLSRLGQDLKQELNQALQKSTLLEPEPQLRALERLLEERLGLLQQQVYTRYIAFARGFMHGGRVDRFFSQELPRLKLERQAIYKALTGDKTDLKAELIDPLQAWLDEACDDLQQLLVLIRGELELARFELDQRLVGPLTQWHHGVCVAMQKQEGGPVAAKP